MGSKSEPATIDAEIMTIWNMVNPRRNIGNVEGVRRPLASEKKDSNMWRLSMMVPVSILFDVMKQERYIAPGH